MVSGYRGVLLGSLGSAPVPAHRHCSGFDGRTPLPAWDRSRVSLRCSYLAALPLQTLFCFGFWVFWVWVVFCFVFGFFCIVNPISVSRLKRSISRNRLASLKQPVPILQRGVLPGDGERELGRKLVIVDKGMLQRRTPSCNFYIKVMLFH